MNKEQLFKWITGTSNSKQQDKILLLNLGFFISWLIACELNTVFNCIL